MRVTIWLMGVLLLALTYAGCGDDWPNSFECDPGFTEWKEGNTWQCLRADQMCNKKADACVSQCGGDPESTFCPTACEDFSGIKLDIENPATGTAILDKYRFCCDLYFLNQNCPDCSDCGKAEIAFNNEQCLESCVADCQNLSLQQTSKDACRSDCLSERMVCLHETYYKESAFRPPLPRATETTLAGVETKP